MFKNRDIQSSTSLLNALKKMELLEKKLLIVLENLKFVGLLSIGDIQRAIIQNKPLDTTVGEILRKTIKVARKDDLFEETKQMMFDYRMELCPVINEANEVIDIYFWEDIFKNENPSPKKKFEMPVIIMAGGSGTRLKPLTNVLPKPLIPIGPKTIIEDIIDNFGMHGCREFHISVNYKADLIKYYLQAKNLPYDILFFNETEPLGTAGSLSLLRNEIKSTFFVSNCDVLVDQDYSEILDYHNFNKNQITIVAAIKNIPIAYGTIETKENGQLIKLLEKPDLTIKINTGMYILEPELIEIVPDNTFFNFTDLITIVMRETGKVGVFPVSENSWKDIGSWDLYLKMIRTVNGK
jgi:dTDP-glucose pyrophosphorylase